MYESACGMVEDFSQTERASRLKLSYYAKIGQKEMVVLYVVSKIGQNICVGYDPNNGQLMSLAGYDILAIDAAYCCT